MAATKQTKKRFVVNQAPQFSVQHRVRELFDVQPEVRSFSLGMAAEQVSRNEQKSDLQLETIKASEDVEKNAELPQQDLEGLLGNNFRLNDVVVPTVDDSAQNGKRKLSKGEKGNVGRLRSVAAEHAHKSQGKGTKESISSLHELLTESAVKEDLLAQLTEGVRPKGGSNKGKGVRKKEMKDGSIIDVDTNVISSSQVRSKLATVQQFKGSKVA